MSMKFTSGLVLGIVILAGVLGFAYYHYHAAGKTITDCNFINIAIRFLN